MCEICYCTKPTHSQFHVIHNKAKCVFNLIHYDTWGHYKESSSSRAHYFSTIVDDASRATWVYLMHDKGEPSDLSKTFIVIAKTQCESNVKIMRIFDTPQQNGRERKHGHMLNVVRALPFQSHLPMNFMVVHLRTLSKVLNEKTTYDVLHHQAPSYEHIRTFGMLCLARNRMKIIDKFATLNKNAFL